MTCRPPGRRCRICPAGWSAVTLAGEIARTGGSVTGGAAVRESGTLGRERELRDLPDEITRLSGIRDAALAAQDDAIAVPRQLGDTRQEVEGERSGLLAAKKERAGQRARLARWLDDLRTEQAAAERRRAALDAAGAERADATTRLDEEERSLTAALAAARQEHEAAQAELGRESAPPPTATRPWPRSGGPGRPWRSASGPSAAARPTSAPRSGRWPKSSDCGPNAPPPSTASAPRSPPSTNASPPRLPTCEAQRARLMAGRPPLEAAARQAEAEIARLDRSSEGRPRCPLLRRSAARLQGLGVERPTTSWRPSASASSKTSTSRTRTSS